jgi:RND superfamily putative drug exporter
LIGFGLAIAVLFDAFMVRMAIVPAILSLLGDKAWYLPRPLARILSNIDIEGEKLSHKVPVPTAAVDEESPPTEPSLVR